MPDNESLLFLQSERRLGSTGVMTRLAMCVASGDRQLYEYLYQEQLEFQNLAAEQLLPAQTVWL